ncbi:rhodanese-like domain-containing protein [Cupriavidus basilensis]
MGEPSPTSGVPGAELVLRVRELAPNPSTQIIVNCAGRTRSIIGTQSLINAGIPNPVAALRTRNGTIGWTLAGQTLDHGASRRAPLEIGAASRAEACTAALSIAARAGCGALPTHRAGVAGERRGRTLYRFDVRTPEEYAGGHLPGFVNAPRRTAGAGDQPQRAACARRAHRAMADDDGVRADMSASWLAQMGWDVSMVVEPEIDASLRSEAGVPRAAARCRTGGGRCRPPSWPAGCEAAAGRTDSRAGLHGKCRLREARHIPGTRGSSSAHSSPRALRKHSRGTPLCN